MEPVHFTLNAERVDIRDVSPNETLLNFLRYSKGLTGTKEGCAEGDCGACTVLVVDAEHGREPRLRAVNSCLLLLPMLHGREVFTVEGLKQESLHPVQEAMVDTLGSQCGFCTPGVVMSMAEAAYRHDIKEPWQLDDQMCGNLCRCTGYRPIRDAARRVVGTFPEGPILGSLQSRPQQQRSLDYEDGNESFSIPTDFDALFSQIEKCPEAQLIAGGTDLSLEITKAHRTLPRLISLEAIAELQRLEFKDDGVFIGSALPLSELESALSERVPLVTRMLRFFGARQIKHRATAGGNLCNASPIGDLPPVMLALNAQLHLRSQNGTRIVSADDFFLGYRKTALRPGEILEGVWLADLQKGAKSGAYKVSRRRELDISAVAAAFVVRTGDEGTVEEARLGVGGVAATPVRATQTENYLMGKIFCEEVVEQAATILENEFSPLSDLRGSEWYRRKLVGNFLRGFFIETQSSEFVALPNHPTGTMTLVDIESGDRP